MADKFRFEMGHSHFLYHHLSGLSDLSAVAFSRRSLEATMAKETQRRLGAGVRLSVGLVDIAHARTQGVSSDKLLTIFPILDSFRVFCAFRG